MSTFIIIYEFIALAIFIIGIAITLFNSNNVPFSSANTHSDSILQRIGAIAGISQAWIVFIPYFIISNIKNKSKSKADDKPNAETNTLTKNRGFDYYQILPWFIGLLIVKLIGLIGVSVIVFYYYARQKLGVKTALSASVLLSIILLCAVSVIKKDFGKTNIQENPQEYTNSVSKENTAPSIQENQGAKPWEEYQKVENERAKAQQKTVQSPQYAEQPAPQPTYIAPQRTQRAAVAPDLLNYYAQEATKAQVAYDLALAAGDLDAASRHRMTKEFFLQKMNGN